MKRIKFRINQQRKFLKEVLIRTNSPSLRELSNRIGISYSTLKNYYNESRNFPESLFKDLCYISGIDFKKLSFVYLEDNFGQVIGGRKSRK